MFNTSPLFNRDSWDEIFGSLSRHKMRTAITAFGVFWGIFMLVMLIGAGKGLENGVKSNFPTTQKIVWVWTRGQTTKPYKGFSAGRHIQFDESDLHALEKTVGRYGEVIGINRMGSMPVAFGNKRDSFAISGSHATIKTLWDYRSPQGRFLNPYDQALSRKVAVIGTRVQEVLFGRDAQVVGQTILIQNVPFTVVGVYRSPATGERAQRDEGTILIPNATLRKTFNQTDRIGSILLAVDLQYSARTVEELGLKALRENKKIHPDDAGAVGSWNSERDIDEINGLFLGIGIFSWLVAIGTILAGVFGVSNIMLIIVKERTKEIGIRKALGATPLTITASIVQESLLITVISGYLGLAAGVLCLEGINLIAGAAGIGDFFKRPEIDLSTAFVALTILVVTGALASFIPAQKAAAVNPIAALQEE